MYQYLSSLTSSRTFHGGQNSLKAKYKARALALFRIHWQLTSEDWVLHLDEETFVDWHALRTCIDVIQCNKNVDYAQVYMNSNSLSTHYGITSLTGNYTLQSSQLLEELALYTCRHQPS